MESGNGLADAPFVLTLEMDGESFGRFEALRRRHYPPERNRVPAHVTMFNQLPEERAREINALLSAVAQKQKPIDIEVGEPKLIARGVAVFLRSPRLSALRDRLADEWRPWLTDQDLAGFRPHVTIQNRVSESEARETLRLLAAERIPRNLRGVGLHLWRYRDGRWDDGRLFRFSNG